MNKLLSAAITALLLLPLQAFSADAAGVWKATFETQVGQQNYTYTLMVDGNTVTGTISSSNGETPVVDGKVDGDSIMFTENLTYQGMQLVVKYTGTFVSDNEISFTRDVGGFATEALTATRSTE
jgi:hypothetical protein